MTPDNLTAEHRSKGGQNSSPTFVPDREQAAKGGRNSEGFASDDVDPAEAASKAAESTWHAKRDRTLQEYPDLWEAYGDRPPAHPGGEIKEGYQDP